MIKKLVMILFIIIFICGCDKDKEVYSYIDNDKRISINYPITGIGKLDDAISSYITNIKTSYNKNYKNIKNSELNISYSYKKVNDNLISIGLITNIYAEKSIYKIKTFAYDKNYDKFLSIDNVVEDIEALDYDIKAEMLKKYRDADMDFLASFSYDYFTIDGENLTIYFNPVGVQDKYSEIIYLDIPLNTLDLLFDVKSNSDNDLYFDLKKRNINPEDKVIALTFDDGPSNYTKDIINILKENNAVATFFVVGNRLSFYEETLNKMLKNGNEIGNHSYSHKWLNRLSKEEFIKEIDNTQNEVKRITGFVPKVFRPTYGGYSDKLKGYTDLTFVLWDIDSNDWKVKSANKIYNNIINGAFDGGIVLMHDNHKYASDSLDKVIKKLKNDGYNFVTISELLEVKKLRDE